MPTDLAITTPNLTADPRSAAALSRWDDALRAEGWHVDHAGSPGSVADTFRLCAGYDHVQLFGAVAVPQVRQSPDGHGLRAGDCDAPYASADLSAWQIAADGSYNAPAWPSVPVRTVSRIDVSGLTADEPGAFAAVLARNHAYRTGGFEYTGVACLVDRFPDWQFPGMRAGVLADFAGIVGAGNVVDLTSQYPDERFFQTYAGRSFLLGALLSGGDPFSPHEFYVGRLSDFASSQVQIGVLELYCSYGWQFETYPLLRGALLGGSLASFWNPQGSIALAGWQGPVTLGTVIRGYQRGSMLSTLIGDGTLRRRDQDMGASQAQVDKLEARVAALEKAQGSAGTGTTTGGGSTSGIVVTAAYYEVVADPSKRIDVTAAVAKAVAAGLSVTASDAYGDPAQGWPKQLRVLFTRAGVADSRVIAQGASQVIA